MIFRRIQGGFQTIIRRGASPFRDFGNSIARMRANNPVARGGQRMAQLRGRLGYYTRLPQRYLGISTGDSGRSRPELDKASKRDDDQPSMSRAFALGNTPEEFKRLYRSRRKVPAYDQTVGLMNHMQVHLWDSISSEHKIIHIGRLAGKIEAQHVLNGEKITFMIASGANVPRDKNVMVRSASRHITINGNPLEGEAILPKDSRLSVKGRWYHVDLQADDAAKMKPAYVHSTLMSFQGPRRVNEDAIGVYESDYIQFFAIADGVGSGYAGDRMSEFAVKYLMSAVHMNYDLDLPWGDVFLEASASANTEMRNFLRKINQKGGTTFTGIMVDGWNATILHVGDSRLYLMRHQTIELLTTEHSDVVPVDDETTENYIETQVVLSRAFGKSDTIKPEVLTLALEPGDRLLLCSDGISTPVADDELAVILDEEPLQLIPEQLVTLVQDRRGTDNASVVVMDILTTPAVQKTGKIQQDRVFRTTHKSAIPYKKLSEIKPERRSRSERSQDGEPGIGLGCSVLALLLILMVIVSLWNVNFDVPDLFAGNGDSAGAIAPESSEAVGEESNIDDPNQVATLTPTNEAEEVPIVTPVTPVSSNPSTGGVGRPTIAPESSRGGAIPTITPFEDQVVEPTETVRPRNRPR